MATPGLEEDGVTDRTSRHPAEVRPRSAPGRIARVPAQMIGACTARQNDAERGHPELVSVAGPLPARSPLPPRQLPERKAVLCAWTLNTSSYPSTSW